MASPYGPMLLICNDRSRGRSARRALSDVKPFLEERALDYEVVLARAAGEATTFARSALREGTRFLVAVGGDRTVREVVNGMLEDDRAVRVDAVLGVIAAGTTCDFIKTFGIPPAPSHAAAHLDGPESFPIDAGKITYLCEGEPRVSYFANMAEVGLGAKVAARAARLPAFLGPTEYLVAFWTTVIGHRASEVVVDLVDRRYEGPLVNLVIANGQFSGGGIKIAPRAAPTDGLLDVQIHRAGILEMIAVMPRAYKGEHVPHPDIKEAKRVRVSVASEEPLPIQADGEVLGHTPATFEVLPEALRLKV